MPAMSLPGTIVLCPNEFTQPDYSVIYKDPDGRELGVGSCRVCGRKGEDSDLILA